MDVPGPIKCLYDVGPLATVTLTDFSNTWRLVAGNQYKFRELCALGLVAKSMCTTIIGHEGGIEIDGDKGEHLPISGYLTILSKLAHILFVLYHQHKTNFISSQKYRNCQAMIRNMYIAVTQTKINGVEDLCLW